VKSSAAPPAARRPQIGDVALRHRAVAGAVVALHGRAHDPVAQGKVADGQRSTQQGRRIDGGDRRHRAAVIGVGSGRHLGEQASGRREREPRPLGRREVGERRDGVSTDSAESVGSTSRSSRRGATARRPVAAERCAPRRGPAPGRAEPAPVGHRRAGRRADRGRRRCRGSGVPPRAGCRRAAGSVRCRARRAPWPAAECASPAQRRVGEHRMGLMVRGRPHPQPDGAEPRRRGGGHLVGRRGVEHGQRRDRQRRGPRTLTPVLPRWGRPAAGRAPASPLDCHAPLDALPPPAPGRPRRPGGVYPCPAPRRHCRIGSGGRHCH
jgi:hypothetical protein